MTRKLLILLVALFLLLDVISSNNNNVYAANTEAGVVEDLVSNSANDKDNEVLKAPLDEQTGEAKAVTDNAVSKAIDEKGNVAEEHENNGGKEAVKESSTKKSEAEDTGLDDIEDNEDTDDLQEKRRRRNNLRNRRRQQENAKTDFQALALSENAPTEAVDQAVDPATDNIIYIQPATEVTKQEKKSEVLKDINITSRRPKINTRSTPRVKNQKKPAAAATNRQRGGNERNRRTAAKKSNARKAKARPARRQPARSARRSTKKFMVNGIKSPKSNRGRAANRKRQQRPRARAGR